MKSMRLLLGVLAMAGEPSGRVSLGDIEERLRALGEGTGEAISAKKPGLAAGAAAGLSLLAALTYLLGRRRGRKRATVLEIRRV